MSKILIREIKASDNQFIKDLVLSVLDEFGAKGSGFASSDHELVDMYQSYQAAGRSYLIIEEEGELLGGAGIAELDGAQDSNTCELRKMYLLPQTRGKGLGKKLIDACIEQATKMSYKAIYLETMNKMSTAQELYKSRGFKYLDQRMGNTGHHSCPVFMLKSLN